jgi:hypothetical protein
MIKHGQPPYLECSSQGDKRFSAYYARIRRLGNKSIEELYQAKKVFKDGATGLPIDEARGLRPVNPIECNVYYSQLWDVYIFENMDLLGVIMQATGLSDKFGKPGHCCQATELWRIREAFRVHYTRAPDYVVMDDGRVFIDGKESILTAPIDKLDS